MTTIIKKYYPKTLDDIIGNNEIINLFQNLSFNNIPNILLSGDYGSGKSTILNILLKNIQSYTDIYINNIYFINLDEDLKKNKIHTFLNFLKKSDKKIVIIDNYEEINLEHQYLLRSIIKKYNNNTSFLFFFNNSNKIIEQLSCFFLILKLNKNSHEEYFNYLKNIINKEKINISNNILNHIIQISNNFREIINNFTILLNYYFSNQSNINNQNDLENILNISDKKYAFQIFLLCDNNDIFNVIKLINKLINNGYSIFDIFQILTTYIKFFENIEYEKKIKYIELISFAHIKNHYSYNQLCSLLSKMCQF